MRCTHTLLHGVSAWGDECTTCGDDFDEGNQVLTCPPCGMIVCATCSFEPKVQARVCSPHAYTPQTAGGPGRTCSICMADVCQGGSVLGCTRCRSNVCARCCRAVGADAAAVKLGQGGAAAKKWLSGGCGHPQGLREEEEDEEDESRCDACMRIVPEGGGYRVCNSCNGRVCEDCVELLQLASGGSGGSGKASGGGGGSGKASGGKPSAAAMPSVAPVKRPTAPPPPSSPGTKGKGGGGGKGAGAAGASGAGGNGAAGGSSSATAAGWDAGPFALGVLAPATKLEIFWVR